MKAYLAVVSLIGLVAALGLTAPAPPLPSQQLPSGADKVCFFLTFNLFSQRPPLLPVALDEEHCQAFGRLVADDLALQADSLGALLWPADPEVTCEPQRVKACVYFRSEEDSAQLQPIIQDQLAFWSEDFLGSACKAYYRDYDIVMQVGGDGYPPDLPPSALQAMYLVPRCHGLQVPFPKCKCDSRVASTPFAVVPAIFEVTSIRRVNTQVQCFMTVVVDPRNESACGRSDTLFKAEIWADDNQRRAVKSIGLRASGSGDTRFVAPSWGKVGEQTLKVTPIRWSRAQADGGVICLELDSNTDLASFCLGTDQATRTCHVSLFSADKNCCPLYQASAIAPPRVP